MGVSIQTDASLVTAYLSGELDHHNAAGIREQIDKAVQMARPSTLRLDFYNITFMDSSGVGLVMGRYRLVHAYGGKVEVDNLSDSAYKVMQLSGLSKLMRIGKKEEAEDEAGQ